MGLVAVGGGGIDGGGGAGEEDAGFFALDDPRAGANLDGSGAGGDEDIAGRRAAQFCDLTSIGEDANAAVALLTDFQARAGIAELDDVDHLFIETELLFQDGEPGVEIADEDGTSTGAGLELGGAAVREPGDLQRVADIDLHRESGAIFEFHHGLQAEALTGAAGQRQECADSKAREARCEGGVHGNSLPISPRAWYGNAVAILALVVCLSAQETAPGKASTA